MSIISGKTCFVTGACGFIGSHLVGKLRQVGAKRVVAIDSLEYGKRANLDLGHTDIEFFEHRLGSGSYDFLKKTLRETDLLFHLAAEKHNQSIDSPIKVIDANIAGTQALLQAAVDCGIKKVVFTSSLYAYGRMRGKPYSEDEIPEPRTVYGISKLAGEHLCAHFHQRYGLPFVALRYLFIYGPRQYANLGYKSVIVKNFQRLIAGQPPIINGDGRQALDYVFVNDCVEATVRAMESSLDAETLNIATGRPVSVVELIAEMQNVAGTNFDPVFAPADVTHDTFRVGNPARMQAKLGLVPSTPLATGLGATYEWLQSNPSS